MGQARWFGRRQRFTGVNIATTLTNIGFVAGVVGANRLLVKIWGGSNGANNMNLLEAVPSWDGTVNAAGNSVGFATGYAGLTNGAENAGIHAEVDLSGIETPFVRLRGTMATAASNGCTVDVWPIYYSPPGTGIESSQIPV